MACPTANMDDCTKKCKCLGGPCDGLAYDCADPCSAGTQFNAATCDCEQIFDCGCTGTQLVVYWKAFYKERTTSCIEETFQRTCSGFNSSDLSLTTTVPGLIPGQDPEWIDNYDVSDESNPICGGTDMRGAVRLWRCVNGVAEQVDVVLSFPGCTVNGLQRGIHEYIIGGGRYITIGNVSGDCP